MKSTETSTSGVGLPTSKTRSYRTKLGRRILTLELAPTTTAFHAHARLVLMAYLYLPHEFDSPRLSHSVRKVAAYTGLHTETVKRTRKRLVDLGILIKVGQQPGKNGLLKDVLTWGSVLLDEPPTVARSNKRPSADSRNEQLGAARSVERLLPPVSPEVTPASGADGILAVARSNEQPLAARSNEPPPAARLNNRRPVARTRARQAPASPPVALTPEERDGLGTLHRFIRTVAGARNAPARILRALQPILDASDPEVVWDLVLRRNPYEAEDLDLLREAESIWRSQGLTPRSVNRIAPVVV
jgi:hypothetical protein